MDGGTVWNVDPFSAIQQCLEVVDSEEDIIMDIAICGDYEMSTESEIGKTMNAFKRARSIRGFYQDPDEIAEAMRAFPGVDYRHLFLEVDLKLTGPSELDFRNETTWPLQVEGRQDA